MAYNKYMAKRDNDLEFSVNAAFDDERAVIDKVPLYLVNGSLGAGKTSVLEFLLQQSDYKGSRVIENEYANENVDGNIASDLFFIIIDILFGGFVTMILWGWFISPTFNLRGLSLVQSIGLNIFVSLFTARSNGGTDRLERRVVYYLTLIVALGIGWIVHLFM